MSNSSLNTLISFCMLLLSIVVIGVILYVYYLGHHDAVKQMERRIVAEEAFLIDNEIYMCQSLNMNQ